MLIQEQQSMQYKKGGGTLMIDIKEGIEMCLVSAVVVFSIWALKGVGHYDFISYLTGTVVSGMIYVIDAFIDKKKDR